MSPDKFGAVWSEWQQIVYDFKRTIHGPHLACFRICDLHSTELFSAPWGLGSPLGDIVSGLSSVFLEGGCFSYLGLSHSSFLLLPHCSLPFHAKRVATGLEGSLSL